MGDLLGAQRATTVDRHSVGAHTLDLGAKRDQKLGEILNVGLAGGVSKDSGASRSRSRDERVLGCSDAVDVELVLAHPFHRGAYRANQLDERLDVTNTGDVAKMNGIGRDQCRGDDRQRGVFVSGRTNGAAEGPATLDDELNCWHVD